MIPSRKSKYNNVKVYAIETPKGIFSFKKKDLMKKFCEQMNYSWAEVMVFDSTFEYDRYRDLSERQKREEITQLQRQVKFLLIPNQVYKVERMLKSKRVYIERVAERKVEYVADFTYYDHDGTYIVEDTKSQITMEKPLYIIKRKLMLYVHKIKISEVCLTSLKRESLLLRKKSKGKDV